MDSTDQPLQVGQKITATIDRMAHGGEGITSGPDGRIVFASNALPGDTVEIVIDEIRKSFARGHAAVVRQAGPLRTTALGGRCEAAAAGAGCCDFAHVDPDAEAELKLTILQDQLHRVARYEHNPPTELIELPPHRHWRTRVRFGVDSTGQVGLRKRGSHELVTDKVCSQLRPELVSGLFGPSAQKFKPGSEVIVVIDSAGQRHIVETTKASRGRRIERIDRLVEGDGSVTEVVKGIDFHFPPTAFWQAHEHAPEEYSDVVESLLADTSIPRDWLDKPEVIAWDLYGGVGLFAAAITNGLRAAYRSAEWNLPALKIISVDYSSAAQRSAYANLEEIDVQFKQARVEKVAGNLAQPLAVVLDPPRSGAGKEVIAAIAKRQPPVVVHIGCDPATFARDITYWKAGGYEIDKMVLVNAFPGTHHSEVIARLVPDRQEPDS